MKIFGVDIQAEIATAIGPSDVPVAVLIKMNQTSRSSSTGGTRPSPTSYPCRGLFSSESVESIFGTTNVLGGDRVATLIAQPLASAGVRPSTNDRLTLDGITVEIVDVKYSTAEAVYLLHCR